MPTYVKHQWTTYTAGSNYILSRNHRAPNRIRIK